MMTQRPADRIWRGSAKSARDDERRRRLLDAALDVYGTTGYSGATVRAVCELAHVSTRSFYELYTDQSELLALLYRELNDEILTGFAQVDIGPDEPLAQAVRRLVDAALHSALDDERKARVLEIESVGVSPALEHERRTAYRAFADAMDVAFASFQRTGIIDTAPGGLASLILVGGITEALVQRVQTPRADRTSRDAFIDDVADVIVRVISNGPTAAGAQ